MPGEYTYNVLAFAKAAGTQNATVPRGTLRVLGITIKTSTDEIIVAYATNASIVETETREFQVESFGDLDTTDYEPVTCLGIVWDPVTSLFYAVYLRSIPVPT